MRIYKQCKFVSLVQLPVRRVKDCAVADQGRAHLMAEDALPAKCVLQSPNARWWVNTVYWGGCVDPLILPPGLHAGSRAELIEGGSTRVQHVFGGGGGGQAWE